jgi:hypothetical protein
MFRMRFAVAILCFGLILPLTATSQPKASAPDVPPSSRTGPASGLGSSRTAPDVPLSTRINQPKLVPVADTSLLMEAMTEPNLRGLEKILSEKPPAAQAWKFGRGQAMLIAETGNLLMLRPPKTQGQNEWMKAASELRDSAANLAKTIATEDLERSRAGLMELATTCNKCHETFRVQSKIAVFQEPKKP